MGIAPGDTVMAHASVRAVGEIAGGPDQIHLALKDALTADGTLLMYAACPDYYDEVGRGFHDEEKEREILEKLPVWDALTARCPRDNGTLVEFFRTSPGTIVNDHAARFAAWGKQAGYLFSSQPWSYAFGYGSALERFVQLDGRILLIGSDHDAVTFLHYAEHIVDIPDKIVAKYKVPVMENGAARVARSGGVRHVGARARQLARPVFRAAGRHVSRADRQSRRARRQRRLRAVRRARPARLLASDHDGARFRSARRGSLHP